jgi:hypothetical protein
MESTITSIGQALASSMKAVRFELIGFKLMRLLANQSLD